MNPITDGLLNNGTPSDLEPLLVGRYRRIKEIGKGGFGVVDQYMDTVTGEYVAVKLIPSNIVNQEVKRLFREVDIMVFLHDAHPCLITYDCMFAIPDGLECATFSTLNNAAIPSAAPQSYSYLNFSNTAVAGQGVKSHTSNSPIFSTMSMNPEVQRETVRRVFQALDTRSKSYTQLSVRDQQVHHLKALHDLTSIISEQDRFNIYIVMPFINGDLFSFTKLLGDEYRKRACLSQEYVSTVSAVLGFKMAQGLDFLHRSKILHRDIKPENILVELHPDNPYESNAVIADLGLARDAEYSDTQYVCTRYYRPPELITQISKADDAADIWSMGCVLFEICTGVTLFVMNTSVNADRMWDGGMASEQLEVVLNIVGTPSFQDIERHVPNGNPKQYLQRCSPRRSVLRDCFDANWKLCAATPREKELWFNLINSCLAFFPAHRPSAAEVCQHELFRVVHKLTYSPPLPPVSSSGSIAGGGTGKRTNVGGALQPYVPSFEHSGLSVPETKNRILRVLMTALERRYYQEAEDEDEDEDEDEEALDTGTNTELTHDLSGGRDCHDRPPPVHHQTSPLHRGDHPDAPSLTRFSEIASNVQGKDENMSTGLMKCDMADDDDDDDDGNDDESVDETEFRQSMVDEERKRQALTKGTTKMGINDYYSHTTLAAATATNAATTSMNPMNRHFHHTAEERRRANETPYDPRRRRVDDDAYNDSVVAAPAPSHAQQYYQHTNIMPLPATLSQQQQAPQFGVIVPSPLVPPGSAGPVFAAKSPVYSHPHQSSSMSSGSFSVGVGGSSTGVGVGGASYHSYQVQASSHVHKTQNFHSTPQPSSLVASHQHNSIGNNQPLPNSVVSLSSSSEHLYTPSLVAPSGAVIHPTATLVLQPSAAAPPPPPPSTTTYFTSSNEMGFHPTSGVSTGGSLPPGTPQFYSWCSASPVPAPPSFSGSPVLVQTKPVHHSSLHPQTSPYPSSSVSSPLVTLSPIVSVSGTGAPYPPAGHPSSCVPPHFTTGVPYAPHGTISNAHCSTYYQSGGHNSTGGGSSSGNSSSGGGGGGPAVGPPVVALPVQTMTAAAANARSSASVYTTTLASSGTQVPHISAPPPPPSHSGVPVIMQMQFQGGNACTHLHPHSQPTYHHHHSAISAYPHMHRAPPNTQGIGLPAPASAPELLQTVVVGSGFVSPTVGIHSGASRASTDHRLPPYCKSSASLSSVTSASSAPLMPFSTVYNAMGGGGVGGSVGQPAQTTITAASGVPDLSTLETSIPLGDREGGKVEEAGDPIARSHHLHYTTYPAYTMTSSSITRSGGTNGTPLPLEVPPPQGQPPVHSPQHLHESEQQRRGASQGDGKLPHGLAPHGKGNEETPVSGGGAVDGDGTLNEDCLVVDMESSSQDDEDDEDAHNTEMGKKGEMPWTLDTDHGGVDGDREEEEHPYLYHGLQGNKNGLPTSVLKAWESHHPNTTAERRTHTHNFRGGFHNNDEEEETRRQKNGPPPPPPPPPQACLMSENEEEQRSEVTLATNNLLPSEQKGILTVPVSPSIISRHQAEESTHPLHHKVQTTDRREMEEVDYDDGDEDEEISSMADNTLFPPRTVLSPRAMQSLPHHQYNPDRVLHSSSAPLPVSLTTQNENDHQQTSSVPTKEGEKKASSSFPPPPPPPPPRAAATSTAGSTFSLASFKQQLEKREQQQQQQQHQQQQQQQRGREAASTSTRGASPAVISHSHEKPTTTNIDTDHNRELKVRNEPHVGEKSLPTPKWLQRTADDFTDEDNTSNNNNNNNTNEDEDEDEDDFMVVHEEEDEDAEHLVSTTDDLEEDSLPAVPLSSSHKRSIPVLHDATLQQKYGQYLVDVPSSVDAGDKKREALVDDVLRDMDLFASDSAKSEQLRNLLKFFVEK